MAALMTVKQEEVSVVKEIDGVPLFDDQPIDFSGGGQAIEGIPLDPVRYVQSSLTGSSMYVYIYCSTA